MVTEISKNDTYSQKQVNALLLQEGIDRDANLDYTCGIFDDSGRLIATGSCFHETIRCLAVDSSHQGEGLLNAVVSHLLSVQIERGNGHVFLYTKPESAKFFKDLGFYEIARVDRLVFLENRRDGFKRYIEQLVQPGQNVPSGCIVMNANPFTKGHRYLVEQAARLHEVLHLFVLSEEAGPIPFSVRKRLVQEGVSDLPNVILHDSGPYIISAATFPSYFLKDEETVVRTHAALDLAVFTKIAEALSITDRYVGEEPTSLVTRLYNETMASELPKCGINCHIIPRFESDGVPVSASTFRKLIQDGKLEEACALLPKTSAAYFQSEEAKPVLDGIRAMENPIHE